MSIKKSPAILKCFTDLKFSVWLCQAINLVFWKPWPVTGHVACADTVYVIEPWKPTKKSTD